MALAIGQTPFLLMLMFDRWEANLANHSLPPCPRSSWKPCIEQDSLNDHS